MPLSSDDESGLMFVDPIEEKKAQQERDKLLKKKEAPVIKLAGGISVQGGMHPSANNNT